MHVLETTQTHIIANIKCSNATIQNVNSMPQQYYTYVAYHSNPCTLQALSGLLTTIILSLPALWNVGAILALLFYIFGYVSVQLFGNIQRNGALSEHANFETMPTALLTLFRISTSDEWRGIMEAC